MQNQWITVDKEGLAKKLARRGKSFAVFELISNAFDTSAKQCNVLLNKEEGRLYKLTVIDDDPNGFENIADAYTMFGNSNRQHDATKRGRFCQGEKLVLALCKKARISTTSGTVIFYEDGTRQTSKTKRQVGSEFAGYFTLTKEELGEIEKMIKMIIPPLNCLLMFNNVQIPHRKELKVIEETLPTEISDQDGYIRRTSRKTTIRIHDPLPNETAMIYELGIPVVETGDKYHVDVQQKIPLSTDRDNVTPTFLNKIRSIVFNVMHEGLTKDDATSEWVKSGMSHPDANSEAVKHTFELRFGKKTVTYDPSDPEANSRAISEGYTVVSGGSMSRSEWENVKKAEAVKPAGQVTPTPKPFAGGKLIKTVDEQDWTPGMKFADKISRLIASECMDVSNLNVKFVSSKDWKFGGACGSDCVLHLQTANGEDETWLKYPESLFDIVIHELAHVRESDHLSEEYYHTLTEVAGKTIRQASLNPKLFLP